MDGFFFQICQWYYGVYKVYIQCLFCVVLMVQELDFMCFFLFDDVSYVGSVLVVVEGIDFWVSLIEDGIICCDSQVVYYVQNVIVVDGVVSYYCDNWFWIGMDLMLEVQYIQVMYVGIIFIVVVIIMYFLVIIGVECFIVCISQNDYVDVVVIMCICQCLDYFFYCQRMEGIVYLWMINGDFCDIVGGFFIMNVFEIFGVVVLFNWCVKYCFIRINYIVFFSQKCKICVRFVIMLVGFF